MLTSILVLSIIMGLLFRSMYGFVFSLIALFLIIYPIPTIALLIFAGAYAYFSHKGEHHEPSKPQLHSSKLGDDLDE